MFRSRILRFRSVLGFEGSGLGFRAWGFMCSFSTRGLAEPGDAGVWALSVAIQTSYIALNRQPEASKIRVRPVPLCDLGLGFRKLDPGKDHATRDPHH